MVKHVVLLSGGWESAACLCKAVEEASPRDVVAMFVDYNQPYLSAELLAAKRIASRLGVQLYITSLDHIRRSGAVFDRRNERMLTKAALLYKGATIWFGCRAPLDLFDKYGDSNWQFARRKSYELGVRIRTPFILWPKFAVRFAARKVPSSYIYSSEGFNYEV